MASLLFFGRLRDIAGSAQFDVTLPAGVQSVADLRAWLAARDAALGAALAEPGVRVALDRRFADDGALLGEAQELAFMSPLSGG